jgi:hypothetical protein
MAKLKLDRTTTAQGLEKQLNANLEKSHAEWERGEDHAEGHRMGRDAQKPTKKGK